MIELEIRKIVCEILEVEPDNITDTTNFKEDLDADSLVAIEILAALEKKLSISIPQSELERMQDLAQVIEVVREHQ